MKLTKIADILNAPSPGNAARLHEMDSMNVLRELNGEGKQAITTGLRSLDKLFKWYFGFNYLFTGYPSSGKSELLNFLAVNWIKNGHGKIAMYSPESYPVEELWISLLQAWTGVKYNELTSLTSLTDIMDVLQSNVRLVSFKNDLPHSHEVVNIYEDLVADGYNFFITDPFNYLADLSGSGNMASNLQASLSRIKQFAVENEIINCIVEHPRSEPNVDGKAPAVTARSLYGGSMWHNKMDVIVVIDRDTSNSEDRGVLVSTKKVKLQRKVGSHGSVELEWQYGMYKERESYSSPY